MFKLSRRDLVVVLVCCSRQPAVSAVFAQSNQMVFAGNAGETAEGIG
jgi:hypothetical protein